MDYVLAVFRSRTQTFAFIDEMRKRGFYVMPANTPAEAHIGCGVCAVFSRSFLPQARRIINESGSPSFGGFYTYENRGGRKIVERLV